MPQLSDTPSTNSQHPDAQRAWLAIAALPQLGDQRWQQLYDQDISPEQLLTASAATLKALSLPQATRDAIAVWQHDDRQHPWRQQIERRYQACCEHQIDLLTCTDADFPPLLRAMYGHPPLLFIKGSRAALQQPMLAMVGSRRASRDGLANAHEFAAALCQAGFAVVSGMALGIDGAAHQGAVSVGGYTLGVMGAGLERIYPPQHQSLASAMLAQRGLLVSEMPPGTLPKAGNFPRRNRLISGLSLGVLVVEAGLQSGSLITAARALEQGREVFAIPGSIHNPMARGCHRLIRDGAKLVETLQDLLEELQQWRSPSPSFQVERPVAAPVRKVETKAKACQTSDPMAADLSHLSENERKIYHLLGYDACSTDELAESSAMSADRLMQSLLMLELSGLIERVPGGFRRCG